MNMFEADEASPFVGGPTQPPIIKRSISAPAIAEHVSRNSSVVLDEQTFANEILLEFHLSPMLVWFHLQYDQILNIIDDIALY
jgi:hypothetical protein